jgi:Raf kinase inhibitor-like YbhB/YbcL family protein
MRALLVSAQLLIALLTIGCKMDRSASQNSVQPADSAASASKNVSLTITSTAFANGGEIPKQYSCQGQGENPALEWTGVSKEAQSLALIVEDPDAPSGMFVHWVVFDLPPTSTGLTGNEPKSDTLMGTARQGTNGAGKIGWVPPCPPSGSHRYYFRLYALDTLLALPSQTDRTALLAAMNNHVIGTGTLMGTFKKS